MGVAMFGIMLGMLLIAPSDTVFAVTIRTGPAWDQSKPPNEQVHFRTHSQNLMKLRQEGKVVLGGRYGEVGLILVRAASEAEARALFAADSSMTRGVFQAEFHRWRTIFDGSVDKP
jgi:hypothetical protein